MPIDTSKTRGDGSAYHDLKNGEVAFAAYSEFDDEYLYTHTLKLVDAHRSKVIRTNRWSAV